MISRSPESAVYRQIAAVLREEIINGTFAPGAEFASEPQISFRFGVGMGTVKRVIRVLRSEGLIVGVYGDVSRVREMPSRRVESVPRASSVTFPKATATEADELGVAEGSTIVRVQTGSRVVLYGPDGLELRTK